MDGRGTGAAACCGEPAAAEQFQLTLGLPPLLARLLAARGWRDTAELTAFLYPRLEHTHSPWLMLGMRAAVERIERALADHEPIRILGDYDADGTLATVILRQALRSLGAEVSYRLPERLQAGYGLQPDSIEQAAADGIRLAITVDTGIRERPALTRARELGLDVIVTDHHLPPPELPPALTILNPHQPGCPYPDKHLCGSAVAFKLVQALLESAGKLHTPWPAALRSYLKLVALATIADSMPLLGENRIFTRFGLEGLADPVNPGLRALLSAALRPASPSVHASAPDAGARQQTLARPVTSRDVGFRIAPRLNAAGRMGKADRVVELFFAPPAAAAAAAMELESLNSERRKICAAMEADIQSRFAPQPAWREDPLLLLASEGWHRGVLGIVASRILAQTGKPVLVAVLEPRPEGGWQAHGSGRAPRGTGLLEMIETCGDLFDRFGGHAQAVGFSLPAERLGALRQRLLPLARPRSGTGGTGDAESWEVEMRQLTPDFARQLRRLEPWGEANPEPLFRAHGFRLATSPLRLKDRHAKLLLEHGGTQIQALFWNLWQEGRYRAEAAPAWESLAAGATLDAVFRLELNSHPSFGEQLQLILQSLRLARSARS